MTVQNYTGSRNPVLRSEVRSLEAANKYAPNSRCCSRCSERALLPGASPETRWCSTSEERPGRLAPFKADLLAATIPARDERSPGSGQPAFSPDGTKVSFGKERSGNRDVYMMNADGSHQHQLTSDPAFEELPDWGVPKQ